MRPETNGRLTIRRTQKWHFLDKRPSVTLGPWHSARTAIKIAKVSVLSSLSEHLRHICTVWALKVDVPITVSNSDLCKSQ
jgi:hypothetical protein